MHISCIVHSETKCHIHFPDSNRLYSGAEKSSQVSITGEVTAVENARKQIRVSLSVNYYLLYNNNFAVCSCFCFGTMWLAALGKRSVAFDFDKTS